eukprot:CAMPEP_0197939626 /NCGR_PEP_ID=MMETSP1439-20131203/119973_1 /TAXON_ID=66791 /ORGANISM="Gonyaulax spinifera, Strain CCMP409" /LENGTH=281 /DNA_ID=CAMNT_0043562755 /DNA_START=59 /DNA_END=904 /DNA_ORIENTATION=+
MNKYGEVTHSYHAAKGGGFIKGSWWPDFGPSSYDYSNQNRLHPTNTIFATQIERGQGRGELLAEKMPRSRSCGSSASPFQQFRRPAPATEALYGSTVIPPSKSGGKKHNTLGNGKEGSWHEKPAAPAQGETLEAGAREFVTATMSSMRGGNTADGMTMSVNRSMTTSLAQRPSPTLSRSHSVPSLAQSSMRLVNSSRKGSDTPTSSLATGIRATPSWVAQNAIYGRALDSAGLAGSPMMQGGVKRLDGAGGSIGPSSPTYGASTPLSGSVTPSSMSFRSFR